MASAGNKGKFRYKSVSGAMPVVYSVDKLRKLRLRASQHHRPTLFKFGDAAHTIRKSLADYVVDALAAKETDLYYQRIHIFAKCSDWKEKTKQLIQGQIPTKIEQKRPHAKSVVDFMLQVRSSVALTDESQGEESQSRLKEKSLDYRAIVREEFEDMIDQCCRNSISKDNLTGMCTFMGQDYMMVVVEGTEDMVSEFCIQLAEIAHLIWDSDRIFLVEDKLEFVYFENFVFRRCSAVNINEKFPAYAPTDLVIMAQQHIVIMDKLKKIYRMLALEEEERADNDEDNLLEPEIFNKLLPEIQRIDLILNCPKYYRTLDQYIIVYSILANPRNDRGLTWPMGFNYTPLGVFLRSPYDINLTFPDYEDADKQTAEASTSSSQEAYAY